MDDAATQQIYEYGRQGREAWQRGDLSAAERRFLQAWSLLPEPRTGHGLAQSMATALVKFYRDSGRYDQAERWLHVARQAYGSDPASDAHLGFLRGTVCFESGDFDAALEAFGTLYATYGKRPFQGEDGKYLDWLRRSTRR